MIDDDHPYLAYSPESISRTHQSLFELSSMPFYLLSEVSLSTVARTVQIWNLISLRTAIPYRRMRIAILIYLFVLFLGADTNCLGRLSTLLGYFFFPKFAWILPSKGSPQSLSKNRRSPSVRWEQKPAPPMAYPLSSIGFDWKCLGMSFW